MTRNTRPLSVSVIVPARNEVQFIARTLASILSQDYSPDLLDVIVVDGMSDDGTRDVLQRIMAESGRVRMIDNPARFAPHAFNLGIRHSVADVIIIVGGHAEIQPDYVTRCVDALNATGADCVGGIIDTIGSTPVARAIAIAQSSKFGVGGVAFRTGRGQGAFVDTVAFGAYRRSTFDRIGLFDEELVRNQDDELNFRLIQAGGRIWLDPAIRSNYYSRGTLRHLWRQYYQYGSYKVLVIQKRGAIPSVRHVVPGAFVAALLVALIAGLTLGQPAYLLAVAGPYALVNLAASIVAGLGHPRSMPILPLAFLCLHMGYGTGFLTGLWRWRSRWNEHVTRSGARATHSIDA